MLSKQSFFTILSIGSVISVIILLSSNFSNLIHSNTPTKGYARVYDTFHTQDDTENRLQTSNAADQFSLRSRPVVALHDKKFIFSEHSKSQNHVTQLKSSQDSDLTSYQTVDNHKHLPELKSSHSLVDANASETSDAAEGRNSKDVHVDLIETLQPANHATLHENELMPISKKFKRVYLWDEQGSSWKGLPLRKIGDPEGRYDHIRVIFNRVGKCGSRSVISLLRELAQRNQFNFISSLVYNKTSINLDKQRLIVTTLDQMQTPYLYQRHVHFMNFSQFNATIPMYFNIIRDPVTRLVSQYYFSRFGDGQSDRNYAYSSERRYMTFDDCVKKKHSDCIGSKAFYIIPFFCGLKPFCKIPAKAALEEAIKNVEDNYVVVGLIEELDDTLKVLEKMLPPVFKGAYSLYHNEDIQQNVSKTVTKYKALPSEDTVKFMKDYMKLEYIFYEYVKERFYKQKQQLGLIPIVPS